LSSFSKRFVHFYENRLSDQGALELYRQYGKSLGNLISYGYRSNSEEFKNLFTGWERWEQVAASRGYRTFAIEDFVQLGRWGQEIQRFGEKRAADESPVLYAAIFRESFLESMVPAVNLSEILIPTNGKDPS
jgi:hypothetical protein